MKELTCSETIAARRSIRKFDSKAVNREQIDLIIEAARLAPSATNRQPWRIVLLDTPEKKEKLAGKVVQPFVLEASVVFVCCVDRKSFTRGMVEKRMQELVSSNVVSEEAAGYIKNRKLPEQVDEVVTPASAYLDLGIAVEHMALQVAALGLGSCWVRLFNASEVHDALGLPSDLEVLTLLPVGYPAQSPPPRPRLSKKEILIEPAI
ncbi:MAG: nitroreductase family protein [Bacillota bacterium]